MNRALITGGAGFIGLQLAKRLIDQDFKVDLVDDFSRGRQDAALRELTQSSDVALHSLDLTAPNALDACRRDYRFVFHLASRVGVANVSSAPAATVNDNLRMTQQVLTFCEEQKALERMTFFSTSEVYAGAFDQPGFAIPTPETTPLVLPDLKNPRTSYLLSKIAGESLCHYAKVPVTVVRPHNIYGPRMGFAHVVPQLLEKIYRAEPGGQLEIASPSHTRVFCFIEDAISQIVQLAESEKAVGGTVNIGSPGPEIQMIDLAQHLIDLVGKPLVLKPGAVTPGSPPRRCPDLTRLSSWIGSVPQTDLMTGLSRTESWYRAHHTAS